MGLFGGGPKPITPPPPPPPPEPIPLPADPAVLEARRSQREEARLRAGRQGTILTGPQGLTGDGAQAPNEPSLLG